ncbi:helix-turn-helix domain-containing protein, partial [Pseudomonas syringae]
MSISEAARLAGISRPTIYKLMNSGKLNFTSVVK